MKDPASSALCSPVSVENHPLEKPGPSQSLENPEMNE